MSDLLTRNNSWQLLGIFFSPPRREIWEPVLAEGLFSRLQPQEIELPHGVNFQDYSFSTGMDFDELAQAYSSCFEVGNAPVSFHERTWSNDAASKLFEELFRFYEHFGLDLKDNDNAHWPDSILVELDFMQYMTHLESIATNADDILALQRGQRDFLKRHLALLARGISEKLNAMNIEPYAQLARLLKDYLMCDQDYLAGIVDDLIVSVGA